jgi:hypothetical protein
LARISRREVNRSSAGRVAHWWEACINVDMFNSLSEVLKKRAWKRSTPKL